MDNLDILPARLRVLQIIAGVILLGLAGFLTVVLFQASQTPQPAPTTVPIITYLSAGLLVINTVTAVIITRSLTRTALRQLVGTPGQAPADPTNKLLSIRQNVLIITLALLEAAGMMACIAYLLERQTLAIIVVGIVLLLMLAYFPTQARTRAWLEQQSEMLIWFRNQ